MQDVNDEETAPSPAAAAVAAEVGTGLRAHQDAQNNREESFADEMEEVQLDSAVVGADDLADDKGLRNNQLHFKDHFTLGVPSSIVRYRGHRVTVYDSNQEQMLMEENANKDGVTVKRARTGTFGLLVLRAFYTLPTLLLLGFHFVLCFQVFLFLFLNLLVSGGYTSGTAIEPPALIGSILSIPLFVYGLASLMSYCTFFVSDTWNGLQLFRSLLKVEPVVLEWLTLSISVIVPFLALAISLAAGVDDWWEVTLIVLMLCVYAMFLVFAFFVFCSEFQFCVDLVEAISPESVGWIGFMRQAMLITQKYRYAGLRSEQYNVYGHQLPPPERSYALSPDHEPVKVYTKPYSYLTLRLGSVFDKIDPPKRRWTIEELREAEPIITKKNWSLERLYCRGYGAPSIFTLQGPDGLTRWQLMSTIVCSGIGLFLMAFVVLSLLGWYNLGGTLLIAVAVILILCCVIPLVRHFLLFSSAVKASPIETVDEETADDADASGSSVYQVWEKVTIATPKPWYCCMRMILEIAFLFLWPLSTLFATGSTPLGVFFLLIGAFTFFRLYFDAGAILSDEIGSMDAAETEMAPARPSLRYWMRKSSAVSTNTKKTEQDDEALVGKARTSVILGQITHSPFIIRWIVVFVVTSIIVFVLFDSADDANGTGATATQGRQPMVFVSDFEYPGADEDMKYGSCNIPADNFTSPASGDLTLTDFALLATLGYETTQVTQLTMDTWFGKGSLVDDEDLVNEYREESGSAGKGVYYKLLRFPSDPSVAIVTIRGTETSVDTVVNLQLWASSMLAELVHYMVPFGWAFFSILDNLVTGVSWVQSASLERVSYYKETTAFVNALLEDNYGGTSLDNIRVTGASLGGGLAIITGAQTGPGAQTVALTGPNILLARNAISPPVTADDLNTQTFNIIPDRDPISGTITPNRNIQRIACRQPANSLIGCHSMFRSFCELQTNCGSNGRPVFCRCALDQGYEEPEGKGNTTSFREACDGAEQVIFDTLPEPYAKYLN